MHDRSGVDDSLVYVSLVEVRGGNIG